MSFKIRMENKVVPGGVPTVLRGVCLPLPTEDGPVIAEVQTMNEAQKIIDSLAEQGMKVYAAGWPAAATFALCEDWR